ncbi:MAG: FHA domain-containing protein [Propionicimonas sp.]
MDADAPPTPVPAPAEDPSTPVPAPADAPSTPVPEPVPARPRVEWVAELWIDPDWYAAQGSSDPLPSPGLPDIVPLVKEGNLIGRVSHSRGIFPDVDCELDTGCSRRHAMLSTDGTRWWIEDLNSANGTFVGSPAGPLPAMPIPQGRVELTPGQRIYVGAWTRIVVRRATPDEQEALA